MYLLFFFKEIYLGQVEVIVFQSTNQFDEFVFNAMLIVELLPSLLGKGVTTKSC